MLARARVRLTREIDWRRHRLAFTGAAITVILLVAIWVRQIATTDLGRIETFFRGMH